MAKSNQNVTIFAETNFRNERRRFGIKEDDRRRHTYVIGKTGMGKSVLLENMVYSDIVAGKGVCYIDPHGDTVEKILDCIPPERINDVIYFNPADMEYPIAFNVFEKVDRRYRHLVASGLVGVFKKIWADSWGPRLEYLLRNAILALLDYPESTLLGVNRMLVDNEYRKLIIAKIEDPVVKAFWVDEFSKYNQAFLVEAIAPIQNKVGQFLSTSLIRNIVGQTKSSINLREIMDTKKILLLNLSKGRIGEDASGLLGAMIITKIQLAAMSRVDIPEDDRSDFYLYVDEFQNFATDSFANILSEARKYHLDLTIAHQYIEQLGEVVKPAVFGNVGTMIVFRVGAEDAAFLVKEFSPQFTEEDFVNLPKYNIYLKLMIDGVASEPFSATTLPPISRQTHSADKVIKVSRERYSESIDSVEDKIARWSGVETEAMVLKLEKELADKKINAIVEKKVDLLASLNGANHKDDEDVVLDLPKMRSIEEEAAAAAAARLQKNEPVRPAVSVPAQSVANASVTVTVTPLIPEKQAVSEEKPKGDEIVKIVTCSGCGQKTKINFNPDPTRPVYCKECLKEFRSKTAKVENARKTGGRTYERAPRSSGGDVARSSSVSSTVHRPAPTAAASNTDEVSLTDALSHDPVPFKPKPDA